MHKHHNSRNIVRPCRRNSGSLCSLQVALLLWLCLFHNFLSHQRKKLTLWQLRTFSGPVHVTLAQTVGLNVLVLSPRTHKHRIAAERKQIPEVFYILVSLAGPRKRSEQSVYQRMFELQSFASSLCFLVIEFSRRQLKFWSGEGGGGGKLKWKSRTAKTDEARILLSRSCVLSWDHIIIKP